MDDRLRAANAVLEAQRAELSGDAELLREAELWRDASPEECLLTVIELCRDADHDLARLSPRELERALRQEPVPPDTMERLRAFRLIGDERG